MAESVAQLIHSIQQASFIFFIFSFFFYFFIFVFVCICFFYFPLVLLVPFLIRSQIIFFLFLAFFSVRPHLLSEANISTKSVFVMLHCYEEGYLLLHGAIFSRSASSSLHVTLVEKVTLSGLSDIAVCGAEFYGREFLSQHPNPFLYSFSHSGSLCRCGFTCIPESLLARAHLRVNISAWVSGGGWHLLCWKSFTHTHTW